MNVDRIPIPNRCLIELSQITHTLLPSGRLVGWNTELIDLSLETRRIINLLKQVPCGAILLLNFDTSNFAQVKLAALNLSAFSGTLVEVEADENKYWYPLGVDPSASPIGANGVGPNVPHIDMLAYSHFPSGMALLCERPDPTGGGVTQLARIDRAIKRLSPREVEILKLPIYSYWRDSNLINVGNFLERFSILPMHKKEPVRFTSKMVNRIAQVPLPSEAPKGTIEAVQAFVNALQKESISILLRPGDLVLYSQLHYCHGRSGLGHTAHTVASHQQRQLWRLYFNKG
jgi:hypothetical protein